MSLTLALLSALQIPGASAPEAHPCAPRRNLTAAGPPPPVFRAGRQAQSTRPASLVVNRCPGAGLRVEHRSEGADGMDWVPVAQCPALGRWIEAAGRLRLPAPMLRPRLLPPSPVRGIWYTLTAPNVAGAGSLGNLELHILEPPGAPPDVLSAWFAAGEQAFRACRSRGHGGSGYAGEGLGREPRR